MRNTVLEFLRRALVAGGFGPLILVALYLILQKQGILQSLTVNEVCLGIFSLYVLAFVVGGMNVIYQIERLPMMAAILIHGSVLYICYLLTYLINGWLQIGITPLLLFTVFFVLGYLAIWVVIYTVTKKRTDRLNEMLKKKQQDKE